MGKNDGQSLEPHQEEKELFEAPNPVIGNGGQVPAEEMSMELDVEEKVINAGGEINSLEEQPTEEEALAMELEQQKLLSEVDNGMELSLDDEEDLEKMEKIVGEKVKDEQKAAEKEKSKRGPKSSTDTSPKEEGKETTPKVKEKIDLKSPRILEREIKKGTITGPQGRIEKVTDSSYKLLLAPELSIRTKELKFEEVGFSSKLVDAKVDLTLIAANKFGDKFQHKEGDEVISHDWVRVELHKPGRDKDVTEAYQVVGAKLTQKENDKKEQKRQEDDSKKSTDALKNQEATA